MIIIIKSNVVGSSATTSCWAFLSYSATNITLVNSPHGQTTVFGSCSMLFQSHIVSLLFIVIDSISPGTTVPFVTAAA